jgi:hypothetical protein
VSGKYRSLAKISLIRLPDMSGFFMTSLKIKHNLTRHSFLLTLFPDHEEKCAVLPMNGFVLVRQWNGGSNRWEVAIHTKDSFKKVEAWKAAQPSFVH